MKDGRSKEVVGCEWIVLRGNIVSGAGGFREYGCGCSLWVEVVIRVDGLC